MAKNSVVRLTQLHGAFRLDAECYEPEVLRDQSALTHLPTVKLDSIAHITDGQHGYHQVDEASEIRHITARCVKGGVVTDAQADRLAKSTHDANPSSQLQVGDVILSTAGTIGDAGIVSADILPANIDQDVARITLNPGGPVDPHFLVAFLLSEYGQFQCRRATTGQIQRHISLAALHEFDVPILPKQGRVADLMRRCVEKHLHAKQSWDEAESTLVSGLGLDKLDLSTSLSYERPFADVLAAERFDAEYFSPRYQRVLRRLAKDDLTIGEAALLVTRKFQPLRLKDSDTFRYIEIGSLTGDGQAEAETVEVAEAPSRAQWIVEPGDVITSTVRPIRRLSALITDEQNGVVCSSGFAVLRAKPSMIEPEVLTTYLRLPVICEILDLHTTASMYPAIPTDRLLRIPVALPKQSVRTEIVGKVRESFAARREARRVLDQAKVEVERLIVSAASE